MSLKGKKIIKYILAIIAICVSFTYLLSCLTPFVNPKYCFVFTFLALGFPVILLPMILVVIGCLFINRKLFLYSIVILLLGYKNISSTIAFHFSTSVEKDGKNTFKILSWNVDGFIYEIYPDIFDKKKRTKMLDYIKSTNADILCLQDNTFCNAHGKTPDDVKELESMGYPYHIISKDYCSEHNSRKYGTAIFSKYPIINSNKVNYNGINYESVLYADININNKKCRIFTTHLRSMRLKWETHNSWEDYIMVQQDTADILDKSKSHKLIYFDKKHTEQAILAKQIMDTTKAPFIFCADLNSVPASYVYHHLANGLKDAFLEKGFGFGKTYSELSPTLRIDVMLITPDIKTINYSSPKLNLSDHYPVLATLSLPE